MLQSGSVRSFSVAHRGCILSLSAPRPLNHGHSNRPFLTVSLSLILAFSKVIALSIASDAFPNCVSPLYTAWSSLWPTYNWLCFSVIRIIIIVCVPVCADDNMCVALNDMEDRRQLCVVSSLSVFLFSIFVGLQG